MPSHREGVLMHTPDLFLARATECESMAKLSRDPTNRETWMRMASRWHRCAELDAHAATVAASIPQPDRNGRARH